MRRAVKIAAVLLTLCVTRAFGHPAPIVDYIMSPFCFGDTAYFTNQTTRALDYTWNIYEQNTTDTSYTIIYTSVDTNIKFVFPHKTKYRVELIANNGHVISLMRNLSVGNGAQLNFSYHDCLSHFVNMATCYASCKWLFGDGLSSTQKDPIHYYSAIGKYKVSLIVYNGNLSDTLSDSVMVYTINNLDGGFRYNVYKDSVLFVANDSISGPFTQYSWSFGDGSTTSGYSSLRKVYHRYTKKDTTYTVFMLARSLCLASYTIHSVFVPDSTPVYGSAVFPNPVQDKLIFTSDRKKEVSTVSFLNTWGEEIRNYSVTETTKGYNLDLVDLPKGLYILNVYFGAEVLRYKIVKN